MPHIAVEEHLPGITGLLEYRKDTAQPIRELTQILLRGQSTLTEGERELIATVTSNGNQCRFCTAAHTAAADIFLDENKTSSCVKTDIESAPVSEKMKALLVIADKVRESGKSVKPEHIARAKAAGATDLEIHDTVLISALFCLYNRYVDGLATALPDNPTFFGYLAERLKNHGYMRLPQGYDHLKK
ncbi:carboxymuconolactone decarboxylase family protein [Mucilaginibacter sp. L3T2-6]|uniref:carboxymuconolactone decarboxylase family protein n=1 Tax=Mucilaginibacter sp. L3T2-6 TaxID=3062491 RepID=UPI002675E4BE|nr:peroxidase-related enzyme [Mucilaginibacter sp. L3T2-6]MDO3643195.1 peroxidase-related enzyme [Mucilaginibacter sp. L3T2-6]MDV6215519.1 peroxidase-related enzyme [Mucilaginibacter sp. L3T2-6]